MDGPALTTRVVRQSRAWDRSTSTRASMLDVLGTKSSPDWRTFALVASQVAAPSPIDGERLLLACSRRALVRPQPLQATVT